MSEPVAEAPPSTRKTRTPIEKHLLWWTIAGAVGTWIGTLVVIGGALFISETVQDAYDRASLTILVPPTNTSVGQRVTLSGHSNLRRMNHYLVVTDVPTGQHFVQDGPVPIGANGLWSQTVPFGDPDTKCGTQFLVMIFATREKVTTTALAGWANLPEDAIPSTSVSLSRACQ
jgi:hypothetical protein